MDIGSFTDKNFYDVSQDMPMVLRSRNYMWYIYTIFKFDIVRKHSRITMKYKTILSPTHLFVMCLTFDVEIAQYCEMSFLKTHGANGKPIK